jgi:hypothetical protein
MIMLSIIFLVSSGIWQDSEISNVFGNKHIFSRTGPLYSLYNLEIQNSINEDVMAPEQRAVQ